jgi:hypothetical protein
MKNWFFTIGVVAGMTAGMTAGLIGCGARHGNDGFGGENRRLTCLGLGYDSIIYYAGTSKEMRDVPAALTGDRWIPGMKMRRKHLVLSHRR